MEPVSNDDGVRTESSQVENDAFSQLSLLLKDPGWQSKYIEQVTQAESEKIRNLEVQIGKDGAKAAGQKLSEQLGGVRPTPEDYKTKLPALKEAEVARLRLEYGPEFQILNSNLMKAGEGERKTLSGLSDDLERRRSDPELIAAFDAWGGCPNHAGDRGIDGQGFNAGVIHYFEYRAFQDKQGRSQEPMTLDGFIKWSKELFDLVKHPDSSKVQKTARMEDSSGKQALYILAKDGRFIISYFIPGKEPYMVTVIPGQKESEMQRRVDSEISTPVPEKQAKRLNYLGGGVHQLT